MRKIFAFSAALLLLVTQAHAQITPGQGTALVPAGGAGGSGGGTAGNPTATAGATAINGSASTYMRSDAAPAISLGSASTFGVVKPDGTTITASGGVLSSVGAGVASLTTTCPTSGPTTGAVTLAGGPILNEQTGTTYTLAASDCGKHVTMNNASAIAVGAAAGTQIASFGFVLDNKGAGIATFTPYSGTINGQSTLKLSQYQSCNIVIDIGPTNWIAECGSSTPSLITGTVLSPGPNGYAICTGTCTVTLPVPSPGVQYCAINGDNVATVITLAAISGVQFETTARTSYKTANTSIVSSGAVNDKICYIGLDATHYIVGSFNGTWS